MAKVDYSPGVLYRAPLVLWVEDELTRSYLATLWDDVRIQYLVAGGNEGVRVMVDSARSNQYLNVFGVVDRDDGKSNIEKWSSRGGPPKVCRLPVHEIENYLLDGEALRHSRYNNRDPRCTGEDLEGFMRKKAEGLLWYTTCRQTLNELKMRFQADFPALPPQDLDGREAALRYICDSPWFLGLDAKVKKSSREGVDQALERLGERAANALAVDDWRRDFAAKEILGDVVSRFCHRPGLPGPRDSASIHANIAQEVAEQQRMEGRVPSDLKTLKDAFENWLNRTR
ncbi:hypothetical protein [Paludisphaera sp.]|uniref:hypothetical protein n=1 Tax=Paludisphaera sp. TaxID=2017432 RepID=UPI00301E0BC5